MKPLLLGLIVPAAIMGAPWPVHAQGTTASGSRTVAASDLQAGKVVIIGRLGFELGSVVSVEGRITPSKSLEFDNLLEVVTINGLPVKASLDMPFEIAAGSNLAAGQLPPGRLLSLRVYETGGMVGVPERAMKETQIVQTVAWQFRTSLVLLNSKKP